MNSLPTYIHTRNNVCVHAPKSNANENPMIVIQIVGYGTSTQGMREDSCRDRPEHSSTSELLKMAPEHESVLIDFSRAGAFRKARDCQSHSQLYMLGRAPTRTSCSMNYHESSWVLPAEATQASA